MISLPEDFVILKFFELGFYPKYNKFNNVYQCSCPICREGKSLGKKRRCYYIPKNENIFCHNCGWSGKPFRWIKEVSKCSDNDIIKELKDMYLMLEDVIDRDKEDTKPTLKSVPYLKIVLICLMSFSLTIITTIILLQLLNI